MLTLGSLFDGIGTWQLSATKAGIKPVYCSEIDDFPATVSAYHFPKTKQLGDITKINVNELEPVDIICAGSPCQDLSVAGKRAGLEGERSGLFRTAIKLVHGLRKRTGKPRYFVWENVCFTEGTLVTTDKGFKEIQDIVVGDMVLTKSGEYNTVVKTYVHDDKDTVIVSACGTEPLTVTPNHPFWVRHGLHTQPRSFSAPSWVSAGEIKRNDWIAYKTDGYGDLSIGLPFAYAVGRWLADGSIVDRGKTYNGSKGGQRFRIFISTGYKKYDSLKAELSKLPYNICENKMKHAINFTFTSDEFAKMVSSCGKGAKNKKLPPWIFELTYEEQKEVLRGYLDGDGYMRRENQVTYTTISKHLAYGMARLIRNVYHVGCSIVAKKAKENMVIEGRNVNAKKSYDGYFCMPCGKRVTTGAFYEDGFVWCRVKGVENGERKVVYNISVSRDNTFCANGIVVHNCGAFSTNKGLDFRAVLEEITKTEIPMPKDNKWADSGMVEWNGCSLAWRVLDAQGWGVPQRRRRIFLVADFAGHSAGEILFVEQGLHGDFAESEGERQEAAANVGTSTDSASRIGLDIYNLKMTGDKACTVTTKTGQYADASGPSVLDAASGFKYRQGAKAGGIGYQNGKAPTLDTTQNYAVYDISHRQDVIRPQDNGTLPCLTARAGTGGNNLPVVHSYCIAGNTIDRRAVCRTDANCFSDVASTLRAGAGAPKHMSDICGRLVLNTVDRHAVAECFPQNAYDKFLQGTPLTTLKACGGSYGGGSENLIVNISSSVGKVRRLTPTECERLQGLPDGYTDIEFNGKPAPDSRRYKAIGNGMAVPCSTFIMRRIAEVSNGQNEGHD